MSIHLDRHYEPLHPVFRPDHLSGVRVHDSPPPTLTARSGGINQQLDALRALTATTTKDDIPPLNHANSNTRAPLSMDMFKDPSAGSNAGRSSIESARMQEEDRRSPPEVEMDPRGTLETVSIALDRAAALSKAKSKLRRRAS